MWKVASFLFTFLAMSFAFLTHAETALVNNPEMAAPSFESNTQEVQTPPAPIVEPIKPFTGKIVKNKVRLRVQPVLDSKVVRELNKNDLLIVLGETEDFYIVQPPSDTKAYVFRTYVLDNVVEGNRVNVRLEPDMEAPIIAQLNSGDYVKGIISAQNNKWLEINVPSTTRFYISKEYIEKIGDASLMAKIEKRRDDVNQLLHNTTIASQAELQKPFEQVKLNGIVANYNKIIKEFTDFPDQAARAKELLSQLQDDYLKKKVAYLESQKNAKAEELQAQNQANLEKISQLEQQLKKSQYTAPAIITPQVDPLALTTKMASWVPVEESIFTEWSGETGGSKEEYEEQQKKNSIALRGMLEPYDNPVKNKPGDYRLINKATGLPIAYLYSTQVNLQPLVGHEITAIATVRPNKNFAFPAYFVLSLE